MAVSRPAQGAAGGLQAVAAVARAVLLTGPASSTLPSGSFGKASACRSSVDHASGSPAAAFWASIFAVKSAALPWALYSVSMITLSASGGISSILNRNMTQRLRDSAAFSTMPLNSVC